MSNDKDTKAETGSQRAIRLANQREAIAKILEKYYTPGTIQTQLVHGIQKLFFSEVAPMQQEIEQLKKFKTYVHQRLDDAGIVKEPNGEHSKHGCRIGDRLDIVLDWVEENDKRKNRVAELKGLLRETKTYVEYDRNQAIKYSHPTTLATSLLKRITSALSGTKDEV